MRQVKLFSVVSTLFTAGLLILSPGCEKTDPPDHIDPPTVTTLQVKEITGHTAKSGGDVGGDGGSTVTLRGTVWNTEGNPTYGSNASFNIDSAGIGEFTSILKGLLPETTYYLRAYAINDAGTSYGEQFSFSTLKGDGTAGNVTDVDGNIYKTVFIGGREWMAENLKSTRFNDGSDIPYQEMVDIFPDDKSNGSDNNKSSDGGTYMWYENNEAYNESYGSLYNWYATENSRGLCPVGWEIPGVDDWDWLTSYLILQYDLHNDFSSDNIKGVGNALKSCRQINSPLGGECDVTEHPRWDGTARHYGTDDFGFNGLPAGRYVPWGGFQGLGSSIEWWTSTESSDMYARGRKLTRDLGWFLNPNLRKIDMHGVRCIRIAE